MSNQAALRTYLRDVIGVMDAPAPSHLARRLAIQNEGLSVIEDLLEFDDDGIKILCSSVRKPGGLLVDPNDPNCQIMNPSFNIPAVCEKRLKWAAFGAKVYDMIGRPISHDALNRERLKEFEKHSALLDEHEDPEKLPVVSKTFGIIKAMDLIPSHLRDHLGSC